MDRILLVEPSPQKRAQLAALLESEADWRLEFAEDNHAAIERLTLIMPDVIVTDLNNPEYGLELVRRVRRDFKQVPVVLITSPENQQIAVEALRIGATSFSPESSLETDLVRTIKQVLDMSSRMRYSHDTRWQPIPNHAAFVLENDPSLIGPLIEHLQNNLPSWSDRDRLQIGMAMDEALVNAMHHGNLEVQSCLREDDDQHFYDQVRERRCKSPFCDRRVKLEVEFSDEHICVQISDDGPGFDPCQVPDPRDGENVMKVSGRGLLLIRSFMDQVAHNVQGNQITMTKLRRNSV